MQTYAQEGNKLLDRMEALAKQRNDLVHGVVVSVETVNGKFPIEKLDYGKKEHIVRRIEVDPKTFDLITGELVSLGTDITRFGRSLSERIE